MEKAALILAPSWDALQKMLQICENYAAKHNLEFSSDPNPSKNKSSYLGDLYHGGIK